MDDGAAGEIQGREFSTERGVQQASLAPHHVGKRGVDEEKPEGEKEDGAAELHSFGSRAGDQCRGDDGEHQLIDHEGGLRNGAGVIGIRVGADAAEESVLESADHRAISAERQAVADQRPEDRDHRHEHETLHHDGEHVLAADQAAVEKRQAWAGH